MAKTRELSESIRNAITQKHTNSKGNKAIAKDLEIPVSTVRNVIKKFHKSFKTLPGRGAKKKHNERSLKRFGADCGKYTTQDIYTASGSPGAN